MWINIEYLTRDAFSKASITLSTLTGKVTACVQRLLHLARSKRHAVLDIYIYRERENIYPTTPCTEYAWNRLYVPSSLLEDDEEGCTAHLHAVASAVTTHSTCYSSGHPRVQ